MSAGDAPSASDDFRGSMPVMTAKDLLLELRADVKDLNKSLLLLTARDIPGALVEVNKRVDLNNDRLNSVESWKDQLTGRLVAFGVAIGIGFTILGLILDHVVLAS